MYCQFYNLISNNNLLIQSVSILWISVLIIQQLHKALHVPVRRQVESQKAAFTQAAI